VPSGLLEIVIGGQSYRLFSDAEPSKLKRLAAIVDDQVNACDPLRKLSPNQALLYAALTLAEQLDQDRSARLSFETQTRESLEKILHRIDATIDATEPFFVSAPTASPTKSASS
jgi:cell division protein ZapA (FtsZ GTPase activity inhibitor)